ncbi:MAG: hypothetical protein M0036_25875, partial [Desulfobacteraceae bacterium]|nr:hypothetical protein [Desulfobacteraceae bacterium]
MFTQQQTYSRIREKLIPYGQYLGLRDVPADRQAFTPVDIGYCALLVAVWAVKQYVGAFLGAKAKGRA